MLSLLGLNEYFSGFANIGHNDPVNLLFLWVIPKYVGSTSVHDESTSL